LLKRRQSSDAVSCGQQEGKSIVTINPKQEILAAISSLIDNKSIAVADDTPLIGDSSVLDSMKLVELCLLLEDMAAELGFEFDWTSETAMSRSRSMFRTAGALASEFMAQRDARE
jgi:acyl carrier protein